MAAAAAVMAAAGVIVIVAAMRTSDHQAPQPPVEASGVVVPALMLVGSATIPEPTSITPVDAEPYEIPSSPPIAIDIPAIEAYSTLQYLGLTAAGALEVPKSPRYHEAAWYKYSSEPGSPGPAVILGHVDSVSDGRSIFYHLGAVRPGDEILVTRSDGRIVVFVVDGVRSYPKDQFPTLLVYGPTEGPTLRVITCGGDWNPDAHSFEDNIVVFATFTTIREAPLPPNIR
jgi:hypothetical protein